MKFFSISFWFWFDVEIYWEPIIERQISPEYNSHFNFEVDPSLFVIISGWNSIDGKLKEKRNFIYENYKIYFLRIII